MINIVAILEVKDWEAFGEFEARAIPIMRSHGGKLLSAFESETSGATDAENIEVHYLQFPTLDSFHAYRNDPALNALSELRSKAIASTNLYVSRKEKSYE